jgi:hypothetical protein
MNSGADDSLTDGPGVAEGRFEGLARHTVLLLLPFAGVYLVVFSGAVPTWLDEAYSFNLASDSSSTHMFSALRAGADGSFPLYALLLYGWAKIFGSSEMSLRLNSGVFVLCLVWQLTERLRRYFGPAVAALSTLFVLSDYVFTYYVVQARFYGLLVFLFSLCFWSTWDLLQSQSTSFKTRLAHALFCGLLCLAHPLGLVYTAILALLYFGFSFSLKRFSVANASTFLGGPALFVLWLPGFLHQRLVNPAYEAGRAGWLKYWQFAFFDSMVLFLILVAGLTVGILSRRNFRRRVGTPSTDIAYTAEDSSGRAAGRPLLVGYSLMFVVCTNEVMALLDAGHIIPVYALAAIRYVLVCWVPYAAVIAAIFASAACLLGALSERRIIQLPQRAMFVVAVVGLLVLLESHWGEWFRGRASDRAYFAKIAQMANERNFEIVCESHVDAFYLATRTPAQDVKYLLSTNFAFKNLMLQIERFYPRPARIEPGTMAHNTNDYLYLCYSPRNAFIVNATNR